MSIEFKVRLGESSYDIAAALDLTIWECKVLLQEKYPESGIVANYCRWVFKGRVLDDEHDLTMCEVKSGDCIIVVKSKTTTSDRQPGGSTILGGASSNNENAQIATSRVPEAFNTAMHEILGQDFPVVQACISTLSKICGNIIANPMEEKFRKVPSGNKAFDSKIGSIPGGNSVMIALGFNLDGTDWILIPSASKWDALTACYEKILNFCARLETANLEKDSVQREQVEPTAKVAASRTTEGAEPAEQGKEPTKENIESVLLATMALAAASAKNDDDSGVAEDGKEGN
jgi:hypothetical protein